MRSRDKEVYFLSLDLLISCEGSADLLVSCGLVPYSAEVTPKLEFAHRRSGAQASLQEIRR